MAYFIQLDRSSSFIQIKWTKHALATLTYFGFHLGGEVLKMFSMLFSCVTLFSKNLLSMKS